MTAVSVTVIVPTYNRVIFLPEALQSLLDQTVTPDRILVVDDGSTDATRETVAGFAGRVDYLYKPNGGKSSALNLALSQADTDFIWVFDDDDVAAPEALGRLAGALQANPACGFAYGAYDIFSVAEDGSRQIEAHRFPTVRPEALLLALMGRSFIHQPGLLVRRSCYAAVGPFDEQMLRSQDYDMILRLARHFPGIEAPGRLFLQRKHAGVRGTATMSVGANQVIRNWKLYDQKILRRLHATCGLHEYLPRLPGAPAPDQFDRFSALLERSTVMGRRGLWGLAAEDLNEAVALANTRQIARLTSSQTFILHRLFDTLSDGAEDFAEAGPYLDALGAVASPTLARDMQLAMTWGLLFHVRQAMTAGKPGVAAQIMKVFFRLAPPRVVAAGVGHKLRDKLARRPVALGEARDLHPHH